MAIKQSITNLSGATAEYHRISEAHVNYTKREVMIVVLSYISSDKRDEEKTQSSNTIDRKAITEELDGLLAIYNEETDTKELYDRRVELSNQLNAIPLQAPEDVAPRNIFSSDYTIELPANTDFTLEFAYSWLKENIYQESEDC